ncbi:hypothetical protein [Roseococcus pinisoli]|uniref:Lysozyme inhibitor LprI N-terminal domain-containing protein n=1 Tax=Roseococcus pinisoli TaxID=2835040 RepID=A0ABS5QI93_9PROT|nr:hypothetical protein [Roseococcus pinisoli]MBS7812660.1 hypothetical protein [Roseococcus pinisoli]
MRILLAAAPFFLLLASCAARPPAQATGPASGDAQRILATPLAETVGATDAVRIRAMAEANGMLRHCRLRWEGYFGRMMTQQRDLNRSEAEMQHIAVWHGYWLGATQRAADRDQLPCPGDFRTSLRDRAEALLRPIPGG